MNDRNEMRVAPMLLTAPVWPRPPARRREGRDSPPRLARHIGVIAASAIAAWPQLAPADGGANHQTSTPSFGSSGGNVNFVSSLFGGACCSGTLGALVTDGTTPYILSNNHVLARSDLATVGEEISQPGLADNGCQLPPIVADLSAAPPLGSNVDAAVAQLRPGTMDTKGTILDVGTISRIVKAPAVGLAVAKSGRTTGFTTGTVQLINASVDVRHQKGCGLGRILDITYTNQVIVIGSAFGAAGDSGSLIVSNDKCHQPVALLFAGSSTITVGNPVDEVLAQVSASLGRSLTFVGRRCSTTAAASGEGISDDEVAHVTAIKERHAPRLMSDAAVQGVGVGADPDAPARAGIVLLLEEGRAHGPLPVELEGVKVSVIRTDQIRAWGWNMKEGEEACGSWERR